MRLNRRIAGAVAAAAVSVAVAACGSSTSSSGGVDVVKNPSFADGTTMAALAKKGTITVGTKFDQPGFGLADLQGKPQGFDVEVAKIIAGQLGISPDKITWKESPSAVREQLITDKTVDFVIATYTINDARKQKISFAGPYYVAGQQILVSKDNSTITGPDSLKAHADQKVCSVNGSTPAKNIAKYLASPDQLVLFDVYSKCADALRTGQVAAVTTDNVILMGLASKSNGAFKLVGDKFTKEPYGIGIGKGDVAFCQFIDKVLSDHVAAYKKAWDDTAGKLTGVAAPDLPTADTCS